MKTIALRNKLHEYIRVAEDKKIKAIYTMLESEIEEELAWWKDNDFIKKLDKDYNDWQNGKSIGYTLEEASTIIGNVGSVK